MVRRFNLSLHLTLYEFFLKIKTNNLYYQTVGVLLMPPIAWKWKWCLIRKFSLSSIKQKKLHLDDKRTLSETGFKNFALEVGTTLKPIRILWNGTHFGNSHFKARIILMFKRERKKKKGVSDKLLSEKHRIGGSHLRYSSGFRCWPTISQHCLWNCSFTVELQGWSMESVIWWARYFELTKVSIEVGSFIMLYAIGFFLTTKEVLMFNSHTP